MADNAMHLPPALDPVAVPTLLPCPFCNGTAEFGNPDEHAGNYVFCETCGAASHWADSTEEAGMVWNRRTGDPVALLAEVERLRARVTELEGQALRLHAMKMELVRVCDKVLRGFEITGEKHAPIAKDLGAVISKALQIPPPKLFSVLRGGGGEKTR